MDRQWIFGPIQGCRWIGSSYLDSRSSLSYKEGGLVIPTEVSILAWLNRDIDSRSKHLYLTLVNPFVKGNNVKHVKLS